ncbi:MAG: DUF6650 family protein [Planctomycetota bacterium]|jgi:hypothetical protein
MSKSAKTKLKGRKLAARLTGISTPVGGIDWDPPGEERDRAGQVLVYLAERRALGDPYDMAIGSFVTQSILDMRERLGGELRDLSTNSVLQEALRAMRAACRMFLEENRSPRSGYGSPYEAQLHSTLGVLRALFGIHVARIACAYDLEVDARLERILPPEPD